MALITVALQVVGLALLLFRFQPWRRPKPSEIQNSFDEQVSIIVPCRNEEARLAPLLRSLQGLKPAPFEILVVDDQSTDRTLSVARSFPVRVLQAPPKPETWSGKNWACWWGAQAARGSFLLFTDADTLHRQDSLEKFLSFVKSTSALVASAPPYHRCELKFEKGLTLFGILPLFLTAYRQSPNPNRVYAIGQYLGFDRETYFKMGGHQAISTTLAEDMEFAHLALESGYSYQCYPHADLYEVQMFESLRDFVRGWERLMRLGFPRTQLQATSELLLLFHAILAPVWNSNFFVVILSLLALIVIGWVQVQNMKVSWWSILTAPLGILLWTLIAIKAASHEIFGRPIHWRGRAYGKLKPVQSLARRQISGL